MHPLLILKPPPLGEKQVLRVVAAAVVVAEAVEVALAIKVVKTQLLAALVEQGGS
jgi:hypothetical protein